MLIHSDLCVSSGRDLYGFSSTRGICLTLFCFALQNLLERENPYASYKVLVLFVSFYQLSREAVRTFLTVLLFPETASGPFSTTDETTLL